MKPKEKNILIKNTTIFSGIDSPLLTNTDILTQGKLINKIARNISYQEKTIIDGSRYTIIPGLIDSHVHFRPWMPPLFFQFGVTTIRDVGNDPDWIIPLREKEKNGDNALPRIVCYGPLLDGEPAIWGTQWKGSLELHSSKDVRKTLTTLIQKGVDGFKTYCNLPEKLMKEVTRIAKAKNVPVASDLWEVSGRNAAEMGSTSIEHLTGILFPISNDIEKQLISLFLKNHIIIDPTFIVNDNVSHLDAIGNNDYPNLYLVPREDRDEWLNWKTKGFYKNLDPTFFIEKQKEEEEKAKFTIAYHKAGGKVVAGSDTPNPFVIPGYSLHQELQKMVTIGFTPKEALMTATSTAAELLRKENIGTIREGNLADIVLIEGNPLEDISQLKNIRSVIKNGEIVYQALD